MKKTSTPKNASKDTQAHGKKSPKGAERKGQAPSNPTGKSVATDKRSSTSAAGTAKASSKALASGKQVSRSDTGKFVASRNPSKSGVGTSTRGRATAKTVYTEKGTPTGNFGRIPRQTPLGGQYASIYAFQPEMGVVVIESNSQRVRYTREKTTEQVVTMADFLRARRGFSTDQEMAEVLGVGLDQLLAWNHGVVVPDPANSQLLSHLAIVVQELEAFLDPDVIPDWLLTEQYTLAGRTPVEALRGGQLAEVLQMANATEHGAYI